MSRRTALNDKHHCICIDAKTPQWLLSTQIHLKLNQSKVHFAKRQRPKVKTQGKQISLKPFFSTPPPSALLSIVEFSGYKIRLHFRGLWVMWQVLCHCFFLCSVAKPYNIWKYTKMESGDLEGTLLRYQTMVFFKKKDWKLLLFFLPSPNFSKLWAKWRRHKVKNIRQANFLKLQTSNFRMTFIFI